MKNQTNHQTYEVAVNNTEGNLLVWGWDTNNNGVYSNNEWMAIRNLSQNDVVDLTFDESSSPENVTFDPNDGSQLESSISGKVLTVTNKTNRTLFELTPKANVNITNLTIHRNYINLTNFIKNPKFSDVTQTESTALSSLTEWAVTRDGGNFNGMNSTVEMWNNTFDVNQTITNLPNGSYTLSVKATSKDGKGELYATPTGAETVTQSLAKTSSNDNFGSIAEEFNKSHGSTNRQSLDVTVVNGTLTIGIRQTGEHDGNTWIVFSDFTLTYKGEPDVINSYDTAVEGKEVSSHTLGFCKDEYAPYRNVSILESLALKDTNATFTELAAATTSLNSATWTVNTVEMDAIYNGDMAIADGWNPKGWSRENNLWGEQITGDNANGTDNRTAWYYNNNVSSQYGNTGVFTMPLKADTKYQLNVKYRSEGTQGFGQISSMKVSVLCDGEGLAETELGENKTQTFVNKSREFTTGKAGNYVLTLTNTGNFYFSDVSILRIATDAEKTELDNAITEAESKSLGFDNGEYAPYNNIDAIAALSAAKNVDRTYSRDVLAATDALTSATWTANVGEVNAFYKGDFDGYAEDTSSPLDYTPNGWTATDNFRLMLKNTENYPGLSDASAKTATMSWTSGITYGETAGYTMPLKANTVYRLQFKAAGWNNETRSGMSVSILNGTDGMALYNLGTPDRDIKGNETNTAGMTSYDVVFATGAAGNYVFHIQSGNNLVVTDFVITKAANQYLEFADGSVPTYAPGTYPSVKITRSLTAGRWATAVYPFAVSGVDNIAVLSSFNAGTGSICFETATESVANEPFLMRSTSEKNEITLNNIAVSATTETPTVTKNEASLIGAYNSTNITNAQHNYVLYNNGIYDVGANGATINPYRAYIQIAGGSGARSLVFFVDEETTAIEGLNRERTMPVGNIYNLNGQLVRKNADNLNGLRKGIYIVGGKRITVK